VGDSSYIVEALLEDMTLLANEQIVAPDIVVYEVANAIGKHEHLMKDLDNGRQYIAIFHGLMESGKIAVLAPNENLMQDSYVISKQNSITVYDAVFIALALQFNLSLKTFDKVQIRAFKKESNKRAS
jgi:predicted nucleic acid-binding protein